MAVRRAVLFDVDGTLTWALVTSNVERRVTARFRRLGPPLPGVIVDNLATRAGKPRPSPICSLRVASMSTRTTAS